MQLGLGESEEEKSRGKKAQVWWAEESGRFRLCPLPKACWTSTLLAEACPSSLLLISKKSNYT